MNEPKCSTKNSQEYTKMLRMKKTNESFNSSYYLQSFSQLCSFNSKKIFVLLWNKKKFQPLLFCQSLRIRCCTIFLSFFLSSFLKCFSFLFYRQKAIFLSSLSSTFFANGVWSSRDDKEWVDPTKTFLLLLESRVVK